MTSKPNGVGLGSFGQELSFLLGFTWTNYPL